MFRLGLAFQLLHDGLFLFPFLPVGGGSQIHERNRLAAAGLLFQLGHCRLLGSVVDDAIDHTVVILHDHFRIFQRIVRQESGNLLKAEAVAVMTGYLAIPLNGNDVAYAHGRMAVIGGMFIVEAVKELFGGIAFQIGGQQRSGVGFSTGTLQISTTLLAQEIAGLAPYSGIGYRFLCMLVFLVITNAYLIRYAMKIQKNPQLSPMYDLDQQNEMKTNADLDSFGSMTWRRWAILASLVGVLAIIVYGGLKLDWEMANFAAMFLWLAIIVGLLDNKGPSAIAKGLVAGCKTMLGAALIIGLARAIALILTAGGIIDTIVYALAGVLNIVPDFLQAPVMFIINLIINIFVTSGSGQAAVVMPLFLPVADLVGMTRQTAILAFNFGDGFCNYVLPTSTALMGLIGAANVPYDRWMKFMWKLFLIWVVAGCVLVSIAQAIHLA